MNVLSLSYGKDSLACLGACDELGIKIDKIVHAEVWATETIPADLPPMVEFKAKADRIIKDRWGLEVEHVWATEKDGSKRTFDSVFYRRCGKKGIENRKRRYAAGSGRFASDNLQIYGFPLIHRGWCNSHLKMAALRKANTGGTQILGIAADEPKRIQRHGNRADERLPLVEAGWTEAMCREWCGKNDLLSPIYTESTRGGCWFCPCQPINQLRQLYHNYPELWEVLQKWDGDSPVSFKPSQITVAKLTERFRMEDEGLLQPNDRTFKWSQLNDEYQLKINF